MEKSAKISREIKAITELKPSEKQYFTAVNLTFRIFLSLTLPTTTFPQCRLLTEK